MGILDYGKNLLGYRKNLMKEVIKKNVDETESQLKKLNKELNNLLYVYKKKDPNIDKRSDIIDMHRRIINRRNLIKKLIDYVKKLILNSKHKIIATIFLKNGKFDSFIVYENIEISGFYRNGNYYNIDKECVSHQDDETFIFYIEGYSAPINFKDSSIKSSKMVLTLSSESLKRVVDNSAFKNITTLGKNDKFIIDWKIVLIVLGAILIIYLQASGQIDLKEMLHL